MSDIADFELNQTPNGDWKPVSFPAFLTAAIIAVLLTGIHRFSAESWVPILDSANLALHEAGHPLCGILSERLTVYGGTLFQLIFPLAIGFQFYRQRDTTSFAVAVIWLGENLLNIGRYMADARAQILPLVGNGEHDWTEIFLRWGVLNADVRIGGFTRFLGYLLMLGAAYWLYRQWQAATEQR